MNPEQTSPVVPSGSKLESWAFGILTALVFLVPIIFIPSPYFQQSAIKAYAIDSRRPCGLADPVRHLPDKSPIWFEWISHPVAYATPHVAFAPSPYSVFHCKRRVRGVFLWTRLRDNHSRVSDPSLRLRPVVRAPFLPQSRPRPVTVRRCFRVLRRPRPFPGAAPPLLSASPLFWCFYDHNLHTNRFLV